MAAGRRPARPGLEKLDALAAALIERETLDREALREILRDASEN